MGGSHTQRRGRKFVENGQKGGRSSVSSGEAQQPGGGNSNRVKGECVWEKKYWQEGPRCIF